MITLCTACGTSYAAPAPRHCPICEDERQFIPPGGQRWITQTDLRAAHTNRWQQHLPGLLSLQSLPAFGINQRAFLLCTPHGNILWDCIAHLDDATETLIRALGGLQAIAISHPHYYTTMQDWAAAFSAPIWLHASDKAWIMRDSPWIRLWQEEEHALLPGITLLRLGGHFAGGMVLHWQRDSGVMLSGDILQVTPGADAVSFMWSYPNMLPLSAQAVRNMMQPLRHRSFTQLYGAFDGREILQDADAIVARSAQRYLSCLK